MANIESDIMYEPIGMVKPGRVQLLEEKLKKTQSLVYVAGCSMFIFGALCGGFLAFVF